MQTDKMFFRRWMVLAAFVVLLYWGLENYRMMLGSLSFLVGMLVPFLLGGCIAFILNLPMTFIENKLLKGLQGRWAKLKRPVALILALIFVVGIVNVVLFLMVPELAKTMAVVRDSVPGYLRQLEAWMQELTVKIPELKTWAQALSVDWDAIFATAMRFLQNDAGNLLNSTVGAVAAIFSVMFKGFLAFVFSVYLLMQKEEIALQARRSLYAFTKAALADRILEICALTHKTFQSFITGQCTEAVILGSMFFVSMSIFKMPYALMIGVLVAFTALIPIFGAFIGCAVGAFLILMLNPMQALWFVVLFLVLQQIEGNFIYPKVVGNSVGLPSMWVLLAVTVGGSAMGIIGMLVFIPICSVLYILFKQEVGLRLKNKGIETETISNSTGGENNEKTV